MANLRNTSLHLFGSPFLLVVAPNLASAKQSEIFLPNPTMIAGKPLEMQIFGYDMFGNRANAGGAAVRAEMTGIQTYRGTVVDKENGTYIVVFMNLAVGKYATVVFLDGQEVGLEKPSNASVIPGPMNSNTSMARDLDLETVAGYPGRLIIFLRDSYDNPTWYRKENLLLRLARVDLESAVNDILLPHISQNLTTNISLNFIENSPPIGSFVARESDGKLQV